MGLFKLKPLSGRLVRRMFRKSGMIYLPCQSFFCRDLCKKVLLLMDTGTTASILRKDFIESLVPPTEIQYINSGDTIITASGMIEAKGMLWVPFRDLEKKEYREDFLVLEKASSLDILSEETGCPVVGILGTDFMRRYGVVINFKTKEITL